METKYRFRGRAVIQRLALLLCATLSGPLFADALYRCDGPDGVPLFANTPCDDQAKPLELPEIGRIGSDDGGRLLRQRANAMSKIGGNETATPKARTASGGLTFSERATLRGLEIRRDGLQKDVRNHLLSPSFRKDLREELTEVNRQIRQLKSRQK